MNKFGETPTACSVYDQASELEVWFYWGAMHISYGVWTSFVAIAGVLLYFLGRDPDVWIWWR